MLKIMTAVSVWSDNKKPYACNYLFDVYSAECNIKAGLQKALNDFVRTKEGKKVYLYRVKGFLLCKIVELYIYRDKRQRSFETRKFQMII